MKKILSLILGIVCLCSVQSAKAQSFALRTNAAEWLVCAPNIGIDFVLNEYLSFNVNLIGTVPGVGSFEGFPSYIRHTEIMAGQVEMRYWFSHQPYENFFIGLQATPLHYNMRLNHGMNLLNKATNKTEYKKVKVMHDGVALPVGFNFGYSLPLNHKLSVEFCYGAGWIFSNNQCSVRNGSELSKKGYSYRGAEVSHNCDFSTTNVGVNITYILK